MTKQTFDLLKKERRSLMKKAFEAAMIANLKGYIANAEASAAGTFYVTVYADTTFKKKVYELKSKAREVFTGVWINPRVFAGNYEKACEDARAENEALKDCIQFLKSLAQTPAAAVIAGQAPA